MHLDLPAELLPDDYVMMQVVVPGNLAIEDAPQDDGRALADGDAWLDAARTPLIRTRSIVVPQATNLILNPVHPDASAVEVAGIEPFAIDARLLGSTGPPA